MWKVKWEEGHGRTKFYIERNGVRGVDGYRDERKSDCCVGGEGDGKYKVFFKRYIRAFIK